MIDGYENFTYNETDENKAKYNIHTHNYLCGHAVGTVEDYVKEAVKNNFVCIGISDHIGQPHMDNPYVKYRDLDDKYLSQIRYAERLYGDKITILAGGEAEYLEENDELYKKLNEKLDYLILGQHSFKFNDEYVSSFFDCNTEERVLEYIRQVNAGLLSHYFKVLAHPDLFFRSGVEVTPEIKAAFTDMIITANKNDVLVELNANGMRSQGCCYPSDLLIDACKDNDITVIVSSDCHSPEKLNDEAFKKLLHFAQSKNLKIATTDEVLKRIRNS